MISLLMYQILKGHVVGAIRAGGEVSAMVTCLSPVCTILIRRIDDFRILCSEDYSALLSDDYGY